MQVIISFVIFLTTVSLSYSQGDIKGKILDSESKEPLAFVNIIYNEKNHGTTTNIDGVFLINKNSDIKFLKITYVGYEPQLIKKAELKPGKSQEFYLKKSVININEVTIFPGENPAHRIINKVIENRDINNPEKMLSFAYTSYNKMIFTFNLDDLKKSDTSGHHTDSINFNDTVPKTKADSSYRKAKKFLDSQHLFIMESVSDRKFFRPDKNNEKVIATKVSGLQNPSFALLATQMQSFSFYKELLTIYEKSYLNPISTGSTKKYFFLIEDTSYTETGDTVFVISFRPIKGKNFEGLKGILNINSNKYAIQSVIAEPFDENNSIGIKVQQKYEFLENKQWFPVQLNTDLTFNNLVGQVGKNKLKLKGIGRSYLRNIDLNPVVSKKEFNSIEVSMTDDAYKTNDDFWAKYRVDSLSAKDRKTYKVVDSLGKKENLDLKVKLMEAAASGYIPWKFLNIDFSKILNYNEYEGFRFGLGIMTNKKISRFFSFGGYFAIATRDSAMKYGAQADIFINEHNEIKLSATYSRDVYESDGISFLEKQNFTSSESFRQFQIAQMDSILKAETSIEFRALQYIKARVFFNNNYKIITNNFRYGISNYRTDIADKFWYTETGIKLKFAYNEKFMKFPNGKFSLGTDYPILYLNISKGISALRGEYDYFKAETKITKSFITKSLGKTSIALVGGIASGNVPYSLYYNGHGSYQVFALESENSFATMRMNEFAASRFAALFIKHNFGSLLLRTKKFKPEIALVHNLGFGEFLSTKSQFDLPVRSFEKGYFEAGLLINKLLTQAFIGYGAGVFYRYGPYSFAKPEDNLAFKLSVTINL